MNSARHLQETETQRGWLYLGTLQTASGERSIEMSLSWADYEHWGRGLVRPVEVAGALLRVIANVGLSGETLPDRFDAARLRRQIEGFDELVRQELGFEELGGDPGSGQSS